MQRLNGFGLSLATPAWNKPTSFFNSIYYCVYIIYCKTGGLTEAYLIDDHLWDGEGENECCDSLTEVLQLCVHIIKTTASANLRGGYGGNEAVVLIELYTQ